MIYCWACDDLKSNTSGDELARLGQAALRLERDRGLR